MNMRKSIDEWTQKILDGEEITPHAVIRTAGGREKNLRDLQSMALFSGANGMLSGGYLTTAGRSTELDHQMISDLGLKVAL